MFRIAKSHLIHIVSYIAVLALALAAYWRFETYPLSELNWRGGQIEYLKSINRTVIIWDTSPHTNPRHVLLMILKGDTRTRDKSLLHSMRTELEQVNQAEIAALVPCKIRARGSNISTLGNEILVSDGNWRLVVSNDYASLRCEKTKQ